MQQGKTEAQAPSHKTRTQNHHGATSKAIFSEENCPLWCQADHRLSSLSAQGGAVVAYDTVADLGLQVASRGSTDPVIIEECRGFGLADVLVSVPLFVMSIIGLRRLKFYGAVASWMALGINVYWPIVAWAKQGFFVKAGTIKVEPFPVSVHATLSFIVLFSVWSSWYLYQNRKLFD